MKRINIHFGQPCEIDCIYCKRNYYHRKGNNVKNYKDVLKDILKEVKKHGHNIHFLFTGVGEPLMLPELIEICKKVHQLRIPFDLETNALKLADIDFCKRLVNLGLDAVSVTFNSHIPKKYNEICGNYDYYSKAIKAIRNLEKLGIPTSFSITILKHNLDHFYRIPYFLKRNFPNLRINSINLHLVRINAPVKLFRNVGFPLSNYAAKIEKSIIHLKEDGFRLGFSNSAGAFPYCFFPLLVKRFNYDRIPITDDNMHTKTKYCKECVYYNSCPGVAETYLEVFGDSEFKNKAIKKPLR